MGVSYSVTPNPKALAQAWAKVPANIKERVYRGFGQYLNVAVRRIHSMLRGKVLQKRTGYLLQQTGATFDKSKEEARFLTTSIGLMWETTGHKKIVPVKGCQCRICKASGEKWLHFKYYKNKSGTAQAWARVKEIAAQPKRPFIAPSLVETEPQRVKLVQQILARTIASAMMGKEN